MQALKLATLIVGALLSHNLCAQRMVVGQGSVLSLGSSNLDLGCNDLSVAGTFDVASGTVSGARDVAASGSLRGGTGTLSLSGVLSAATSLLPQNGTVAVRDGCSAPIAQIIGAHQFFRFSVLSPNGRTLQLPAGFRQSIASSIELAGGGQRLLLRSSAPGGLALLALSLAGTQSIARVDVQDVGAPSDATYLAPGPPSSFDSIDRGNSPRFFVGSEDIAVPVPAVSGVGNVLLAGLIILVALTTIRKRED